MKSENLNLLIIRFVRDFYNLGGLKLTALLSVSLNGTFTVKTLLTFSLNGTFATMKNSAARNENCESKA